MFSEPPTRVLVAFRILAHRAADPGGAGGAFAPPGIVVVVQSM